VPDPISVSALTLSIQQVLGSNFGPVSVQGELSQFLAHRSGHWYFTLKDPGAVLNCVMFRNMNQLVRQLPEQGSQVVVMGELNVYGPQGRYNLVARRI
jgi:exodeoxyribonuclease VII large subunit